MTYQVYALIQGYTRLLDRDEASICTDICDGAVIDLLFRLQQLFLITQLALQITATHLYRTQRKRKFFHNLQQFEHTQAAEAYTRHACRQLAATPGFTPGELELVWMQETTQPPPLPPAPVQAVSQLRQRCG